MKKIAILQSNYIPWKGYFDIIANSDVFVFLDDVQYTKNDWRNRNKIKTAKGAEWITIPIRMTGKFGQRICETEVTDSRWISKHLSTLRQSYSKAEFFTKLFPKLEATYESLINEKNLSVINQKLCTFMCKELGLQAKLMRSTDYFSLDQLSSFSSSQRVLEICKKISASAYISGPAARDYLDVASFNQQGIEVLWADYSGYPQYRQLYGPFEHGVSILDLWLNEGDRSLQFLKRESLLTSD